MAIRILLKQKNRKFVPYPLFLFVAAQMLSTNKLHQKTLDHSSKTMALDSTEEFLFIQFNVARGYVSSMSLTRTPIVPIQPKCP